MSPFKLCSYWPVEPNIFVDMGDYKTFKLGGSIKVPLVQELAKEALSRLPPRYARPGQEPAAVVAEEAVPVIDLERLLSNKFFDSELVELHAACAEWGFFQLVNHGVSIELLEKVKMEIQNFFDLPLEEKKKYEQLPNDLEGYGQAFIHSDEQKLDWCDMFYMVTLPASMRKSHILPKLPPTIREAVEEYSSELKRLSMKLIEFMSKALKMDVKELNDMFDEGVQSMRFNYYPPCPQPEQAMGITPHSDQVGFTLLLQINDQDGLEIRKDGKWIPIKPISNGFIFNIGDMLEIVTNGAYKSIEHRGVVNSEKERLTMATFFMPRFDSVISPASSLVTPEHPAKFKSIITEDFLKGVISKELDGKSQLEILRI